MFVRADVYRMCCKSKARNYVSLDFYGRGGEDDGRGDERVKTLDPQDPLPASPSMGRGFGQWAVSFFETEC